MSEDYQTHQIVSREPYESCNVELSENTRGELRISVKVLSGGQQIDEFWIVQRAYAAYFEAKHFREKGALDGR